MGADDVVLVNYVDRNFGIWIFTMNLKLIIELKKNIRRSLL